MALINRSHYARILPLLVGLVVITLLPLGRHAIGAASSAPTITAINGIAPGQSVTGVTAVEAVVDGSRISRVVFDLQGPTPARHTEKRAPYFFQADSGWDTSRFLAGDYTLTVTAYDRAGQSGSRAVQFRVVRAAQPLATVVPASTATAVPTLPSAPPTVSAPSPTVPPSVPQSSILWSADFETGDYTQWTENDNGGIFNTGTGVGSVTSAVAHGGRLAAELKITGARSLGGEPQAVRVFRWKESQRAEALYYSAWYYFPQVYQPMSWWNVFQFKSRTPTRNDPFWIVNVGHAQERGMFFYLYDWVNRKSYGQSQANIPVGRWFHLEVYYRQGIGDGRITAWQDGKQIIDVDGITTMYPDSYQSANWSINNYTDAIAPSDAVIYVDDAVISAQRVGP